MSIATGPGVPCPRCGKISTRYEHEEQPYDQEYYEHWFRCHNPDCVTDMFTEAGQRRHPAVPQPQSWIDEV